MSTMVQWGQDAILDPAAPCPSSVCLLPSLGHAETRSAGARALFCPLSHLTESLGFMPCCVARWPSAYGVICLNPLWEPGGRSARGQGAVGAR